MKKGRKPGTPKTGGRQKGSQNKLTSDMKTWLAKLVKKNRKTIETDLENLEPKDRIAALEKLMAYVIPKATTSLEVSFDQLSESQLDEIVNELSNNLK